MSEPLPIILCGARMLDPFHVCPDDIRLHDIAHHLVHLCRWVGGTRTPYTVLEHSLYMDDLFISRTGDDPWLCSEVRRMRLLILLHDAHEMFTGEIPSWLKEQVPEIGAWCKTFDRAIYEAFDTGLPTGVEAVLVKHYDVLSAAREIEELYPDGPEKDALQARHQAMFGCGVPIQMLYRMDYRSRGRIDYIDRVENLLRVLEPTE